MWVVKKMHRNAYSFVNMVLLSHMPRFSVVEFGSRNINGSIRDCFPNVQKYVGIDLYKGDGVDIIGDASKYTPEYEIDTVVCVSVLEHTPNAKALIDNAFRILSPQGLFIVTTVSDPCPKHSEVDGGPLREDEFYANITRMELFEWLQDFPFIGMESDTFLTGDLLAWARKGPR